MFNCLIFKLKAVNIVINIRNVYITTMLEKDISGIILYLTSLTLI